MTFVLLPLYNKTWVMVLYSRQSNNRLNSLSKTFCWLCLRDADGQLEVVAFFSVSLSLVCSVHVDYFYINSFIRRQYSRPVQRPTFRSFENSSSSRPFWPQVTSDKQRPLETRFSSFSSQGHLSLLAGWACVQGASGSEDLLARLKHRESLIITTVLKSLCCKVDFIRLLVDRFYPIK